MTTAERETHRGAEWIASAAACYIDGNWVDGDGPEIRSINPSTGETLGLTPSASPQQVTAAITGARHAFEDGAWCRLTGTDRGALLDRLADLMERDSEQLVFLSS